MEIRRANYVESSMLQVELQWDVHRAQCIWRVASSGGGVLGSPWSSPIPCGLLGWRFSSRDQSTWQQGIEKNRKCSPSHRQS